MANTNTRPTIRILCPQGCTLDAPGDIIGSIARCTKCNTVFKVTEKSIAREPEPRAKRDPPKRKTLNKQTMNLPQTKAIPQEQMHAHSLDQVAFHLGDDPIDVRDLVQHALVFGRTGSGKTSSVLPLLLLSLLKNNGPNAGGFVFCYKQSDRETYKQLIEQSGRLQDLKEISLDGNDVVNVLEMERLAIGADAANSTVEQFDAIGRLADKGRKGEGGDPFFRGASRTATLMTMWALILAKRPLSMPSLSRMLTSIPHEKEIHDEDFQQRSFLINTLDHIEARLQAGELNKSEEQAYMEVGNYFLEDMNRLPQRTKGGIVQGVTSICRGFSMGQFGSLFSGEINTIRFADAFDKGTIFLIDLNQELHQEVGRLGTAMIRRQVMREIQRREIVNPDTDRLVLLVADEYARILDAEFDEAFLATAREKKCSVINLVQSYDQLLYACGSKEKAEALIQNHFLKIFLANDGSTAKFASELVGKRWSMLEYSGVPLGQAGGGHGGGSKAQVEFILPHEFHNLKTGGPKNDFQVEAIVFKGGQNFRNEMPFLKVQIPQNIHKKEA